MTQVLNGDRHVLGVHERSSTLWSVAARYGLAIVATLTAFVLTAVIRHTWPAPIFLLFVLTVALSAWYGGRGPSILATILAILLTKLSGSAWSRPPRSPTLFEFSDPASALRVRSFGDLIPYIVFLVVALVISLTIEALLRARSLADSRAAELGRVNEEMRHALISRRLLAAEETERRRIARVLHEDVGQLLTAVRMNLQRLTVPHGGDGSVVSDSIGLVDESLAHLRTLSVELRPTVLDDLGLGEAVIWYANRQANRTGYAVVVEQELGNDRLAESIETAAFRIVQQALTNIARHARAKSVRIALRRDRGGVELAIADDGIGFDVGDARDRSCAGESLGLVHMMELAYMAGGILSVNSTKGKGSTVHVQFPTGSVE